MTGDNGAGLESAGIPSSEDTGTGCGGRICSSVGTINSGNPSGCKEAKEEEW